MTNTETTATAPKAKKVKKKGPIRWEAIVPFTIFVTLIYIYFALFFDAHMRHAIEFVGTHANGAEVNIDDIDTSFWKASLEIKNIQVTDGDQPQKNKIQIGAMKWRMLWDALLRGKIAIADASILEIGVGTPRKRPGRVLPKPPPGTQSLTEKVREAAIDQVQGQFDGNVLGDIAAIIGGTDPKDQLKNIENSIASVVRIKELEDEFKKKELEWKERLANLPQSKDLKALEARLKAVKLDRFNGPAEVQASLKELDSIYKETDAKIKNVESTGKAVGSDVNVYKNTIKDLEAMIKKDVADLEARLKIPKLDVKNMAMTLFGPMFLGKVKEAKFYMEKARQYMPPKKTPEEKAAYDPPKPHERIAGRNYKFGRPNSYPLFWLQKAEISSNPKNSEFSGDVSGTLKDVTDDPPTLGRPTIATFKGDFPKQDLHQVFGEVTIDHTTTNPTEKLALRVGDFRIKGQSLVNSSDVQLAFRDARAASEINAELAGERISLSTENKFSQVQYDVGAKNKIVQEILSNVVNSVPVVTLNASVKGSWKKEDGGLDLSMNSNLGAELQAGFEREIQAKIAEAKAKVRAIVDEKIGTEKAKLEAQYKKLESQLKGEVEKAQTEITKFKAQIDSAKKQATDGQKKKLEGEAKKGLDKLLKGGKFKF